MANAVSHLKSALTNATAVAREAAKKQQYLDSQFQIVQDPQRKATFQELFLQLGKIYAISQDVDGGKSASQTLNMVQLIVKSQETPDTHAKCKAIATVASKAFDLLKAVAPKDRPAFLQRALTALLVGKEAVILSHRTLEIQSRVQIAEKERAQFFTWKMKRPERSFYSGYAPSAIVDDAIANSLEAFALFYSVIRQAYNRKIEVHIKETGVTAYEPLETKRLKPFLLEKLKACSHSSNAHVGVVAQAYLSWFEMEEAETESRRRGKELETFNQCGKVIPFISEPILQQCMPEFSEMWARNLEWALQGMQEKRENPRDETIDPAFIKQQLTYWPRFVEQADSRHFLYDFLYQMINRLRQNASKQKEFIDRYFQYNFSSILHPSETLLEPAAFAALSLEKSVSVASPAPASASAATVPDIKVPPKTRGGPQKKPSKKKDGFFTHLDKTSSVTQVNVKTKELSSTSAASPQIAAAASAASAAAVPAYSLGHLLEAGKAFMAQRTVDERVEIWLTDPETALKHPNYQHLSEAGKKAATERHRLPRVIRQLLGTCYSATGPWHNPTMGETDTLHCLVAEIEDEETGKKERSILQYCEDKRHVIYHQFAGLTSNNELVDRVINGRLFDVLDFPELKFSQKMAVSGKSVKPIIATVKGEEMSMDPLTGFVTVCDSVHKKKYTIIPLGE